MVSECDHNRPPSDRPRPRSDLAAAQLPRLKALVPGDAARRLAAAADGARLPAAAGAAAGAAEAVLASVAVTDEPAWKRVPPPFLVLSGHAASLTPY